MPVSEIMKRNTHCVGVSAYCDTLTVIVPCLVNLTAFDRTALTRQLTSRLARDVGLTIRDDLPEPQSISYDLSGVGSVLVVDFELDSLLPRDDGEQFRICDGFSKMEGSVLEAELACFDLAVVLQY